MFRTFPGLGKGSPSPDLAKTRSRSRLPLAPPSRAPCPPFPFPPPPALLELVALVPDNPDHSNEFGLCGGVAPSVEVHRTQHGCRSMWVGLEVLPHKSRRRTSQRHRLVVPI